MGLGVKNASGGSVVVTFPSSMCSDRGEHVWFCARAIYLSH